MDTKQQQHRQHFNLSESAKQMLEELTALHYPGKQRRQSQVIEDLITEAFRKEWGEEMDREKIGQAILASAKDREIGAVQTEESEGHWDQRRRKEGEAKSTLRAKLVVSHMVAEGKSGYSSEQMAVRSNHCVSCQREIQADWKHCAYCGTTLVKRCPQCGAPPAEVEGARFCFECGYALE